MDLGTSSHPLDHSNTLSFERSGGEERSGGGMNRDLGRIHIEGNPLGDLIEEDEEEDGGDDDRLRERQR